MNRRELMKGAMAAMAASAVPMKMVTAAEVQSVASAGSVEWAGATFHRVRTISYDQRFMWWVVQDTYHPEGGGDKWRTSKIIPDETLVQVRGGMTIDEWADRFMRLPNHPPSHDSEAKSDADYLQLELMRKWDERDG